jgi:hypothetical protein
MGPSRCRLNPEEEALPELAKDLVVAFGPPLFTAASDVMSAEDEAWVLALLQELQASVESFIANSDRAIDGLEDR